MSIGNIPTLIVEDKAFFREPLKTKLERVLQGGIHEARTYTEAQEKINTFKKQSIQKLILILDGNFPFEAGEESADMWRDIISLISDVFGQSFLLYLIPFSSDGDTNGYMISENEGNPNIKVLEGTGSKNSDEVIASIRSISQ